MTTNIAQPRMTKKNFDSPDDSKSPFSRTGFQIVNLGGLSFNRETLQPGWRWSVDVQPIAKTASCQKTHVKIFLSGRQGIRLEDGTVMEFGPGDVALIPAGHDAWVIGNESNVLLELSGAVKPLA
ncbi:MAG TPA: cupin domain-containing protein [Candidatus Thermoplasmatota archaeon]|nr:cupin domain-containing protein [Candidatus Thermoplasmatota archaeon]